MTRTNRILNRVLLILAGLVLLAAGAVGFAVGTQAPVQQTGTAWAKDAIRWLGAHTSATAPGSAVDAIWIATVGAALLAVVLGIWFVSSRGRGGTDTVLREASDVTGSVSIDIAVVRSLIADRLAEDPDVVSARVDAFRVSGEVAGRVLIVTRPGVSPERLATSTRSVVDRADRELGIELPLVVEIVSGLRSMLFAPARVS